MTFDGSGVSGTLVEMIVHQLNPKDVTVPSARQMDGSDTPSS